MVGLISNWPFQKGCIELGSLGYRPKFNKKKSIFFNLAVEKQTKLSALISEAGAQT